MAEIIITSELYLSKVYHERLLQAKLKNVKYMDSSGHWMILHYGEFNGQYG